MIKAAIKALGYIAICCVIAIATIILVGMILIGLEHVYLYFGFSEKYSAFYGWLTLVFGFVWTILTLALNEK